MNMQSLACSMLATGPEAKINKVSNIRSHKIKIQIRNIPNFIIIQQL